MEIWKRAGDKSIFPESFAIKINRDEYECNKIRDGVKNALVESAIYTIVDFEEKTMVNKIYIYDFECNLSDDITLVSIWNGKYNQDIKNINGKFEVQSQPFMEKTTKMRDVSRAISTMSINDLRNMLGDSGARDLNHWKIRDIAQRGSGTISMWDCHYIYTGEAQMNVQGIHRNSCNCWNSGNWYGDQLTWHVGDAQYCTVFVATNAHGTKSGSCGDSSNIDCVLGWPGDPATPTFDTGRYVKVRRDGVGWRTVSSWDLFHTAGNCQVQMNIEVHFTDAYFHMRQRVYWNSYFERHRDGPKVAARGKTKVKVYRGG